LNRLSKLVRTELLLEGKCVVWRNKSRVDQFSGELVFDYDLCRYKLFGDGEIAYSFNPLQVKDIDYDESGKVKRRTSMGLYVNYPNGDEYLFDLDYYNQEQFQKVDDFITRTIEEENGRQEVVRLLKSREKITVEEVVAVLRKHSMKGDDEFARRLMDEVISSNQIQGVFNGNEFFNSSGLKDAAVRYGIAVKLEFTHSGAISLKCPGCGSALPIDRKQSDVRCEYCGQSCFIPRKVLDLL
jgi:DNA-directed RNA polymerase subunit RPC12/RpoP